MKKGKIIIKKLILIFSLFISCDINAQNTFKKLYANPSSLFGPGTFFHKDSSYYLYNNDCCLSQIDTSNGNILSNLRFSNFSGGDVKLVSMLDSTLLISNLTGGMVIIKTDLTGTILWQQKYDLPEMAHDMIVTDDSSILIAGTVMLQSQLWYSYLTKLDAAGNLKWYKAIKGNRSNNAFIKQTKDKNYLMGMNMNGVANIDTFGFALCKLDTAGQVLWSKSYLQPASNILSCIENQDSSLTLIGYKTFTGYHNMNFKLELFLMKVNQFGDVVWAKQLGDSSIMNLFYNKIIATSDGGNAVIGTHYSNTSIFDLYILKTDSVGNIQWTRTHGTPATKEEGYDLMQINDNGYLIWGSTYTGTPFGTFGGYLIKSDSIGLAGCQEDSLIIPNNNLSVNVIPLNLADSLMPLNILSSNVTIVSEPLPQISNGCFLTTGNEELLNHNLPYNITSYPNPTTGKITIKTHETTNALDYITVYDSLGKTVLQYPDINGKHELDLSKLAKGTYTIKVVQKDKVSVSKVVVE